MANSLSRQVLLDGPRNFVVKLTGVLDSSDVNESPAVSLYDAINNETRQTLVGYRVDRIEYSIGNGIEILLVYNATNPQQIMPMAGRGKMDAGHYGGWFPNQAAAGYDGAINLSTSGFSATASPQNFTVKLELVKLYQQ